MRARRPAVALLVPVLLLVGGASACGTRTGTGAGGAADGPVGSGEGDVPITPRAVAAVTLDYVSEDTTRRGATYTDEDDPPGLLGADLRYAGDGESDGDLLEVTVGPRSRGTPCSDYDSGCERLSVEGGTIYLVWAEEVPEEDPGLVYVVLQRADEEVAALTAGEVITGDPRELDLAVPVDRLVEIVQDQRLSLTTSQDVVDAGESLADWDDDQG